MEEQSPEYLLTKLDNLLAETAPLLEEPALSMALTILHGLMRSKRYRHIAMLAGIALLFYLISNLA